MTGKGNTERIVKRQMANNNERRRMLHINKGFDCLRSLLPESTSQERMSKASVLHNAAMHIESLNAENQRLRAELKAMAMDNAAPLMMASPCAVSFDTLLGSSKKGAALLLPVTDQQSALPTTPPATPRSDAALLSSAIVSASAAQGTAKAPTPTTAKPTKRNIARPARASPSSAAAHVRAEATPSQCANKAASSPRRRNARKRADPTHASVSAAAAANLQLIFHAIERVESGGHMALEGQDGEGALRRSPRKCVQQRETPASPAPSRRLVLSN